MAIFNIKKKSKVEWTDKTAPKIQQLEFVFEGTVKTVPKESYNYGQPVGKTNGVKLLLVNTDSPKDVIKAEIEEKLYTIYEELCQALDNDTSNFSEGYWEAKKSEAVEAL